MKKIIIPFIAIFIFNLSSIAQSDFSSPYSLYGLGQENSNYFGGLSALGNTGIGYKSPLSINKSNPASLAAMASNSFLYEIGFNSTFSNKTSNNLSQQNFDFNFSHIAIGFKIKDYWKTSFGIVPYTKVNYEIDVVQSVEGTTGYFNTNIIGSGGINEVFWGNGINLTKNFSVGVELQALFGLISKEQLIVLGTKSVTLTESNNYFGASLNAGFQYTIDDLFKTKTTIGGTFNVPTSLTGSKDIEGSKSYTGTDTTLLIEELDESINNFDLPLKMGIGISSKINKSLLINMDYRKNYWTKTYTSNSTFTYKDQSIYGLGIEFQPSKNLSSFRNNIIYRAGANYNSGYLNLSKQDIDNYSFSLGLGIPLSKGRYPSIINVNYSYGKEGTLSKKLIQDNFHKLSINLSLVGNWFQKTKIF